MKTLPDDMQPPDNGTPIPTPIGITLGNRITKNIGTSGGSVLSADGKAELVFPTRSLNRNTDISIESITNNAPNGVGNGYRFLPEGIKFDKPVILKFHYTKEDLSETLADLMGIAFQDSAGIWYRIINFTNDSANKVISASIGHFSDWSLFDVMKISPSSAGVRVNKSISLDIFYVDAGDDNTELAPIYKKPATVKWSVNGTPGGNSTVGTVSGDDNTALFTAPAKVPSNNPVAVSADLPNKTIYKGKTFNGLHLVSNITIADGEKYLLEIKIIETAAGLTYTDSVSMIVLVNSDESVAVSEINNTAPKCNPITVTLGECTATWIPDAIGEVNISGATGTISGVFGDPSRDLFLTINHSGALSSKFARQCIDSGSGTEGGLPFPGLPTIVFFTIVPGQNFYEVNSGDEIDRLTLLAE